ncbi:hypothetical protein BH10ACT3_BH10ACT3_13770 [soil metagenome]
MTDPDAVPVLIVDDQAAFRSAARIVVTMSNGFDVRGEAESGEEAVQMADDLGDGLVLMDINLGGISGLEATRQITDAHPGVVVVLMSTYTAEDLPDDAADCGAVQYVHKEDLGPDVLREIWDAHHRVA